jgi:hypothetical protein
MLRNQGGDIFSNQMSLIIYGRKEIGMKLIERDIFQGKKRGSEGLETYLPGHVF